VGVVFDVNVLGENPTELLQHGQQIDAGRNRKHLRLSKTVDEIFELLSSGIFRYRSLPLQTPLENSDGNMERFIKGNFDV